MKSIFFCRLLCLLFCIFFKEVCSGRVTVDLVEQTRRVEEFFSGENLVGEFFPGEIQVGELR